MIITISGKAGSGKSTVARLLSKELKLRHYSIGDLMRQMASERGVGLLELNQAAEKDKSVDFELDERLRGLGKTEDNFVIDGRLTAFFIPNADLRIFLDANEKVRAQRILNDRRQHEKSKSLRESISNIKKREASEKKRYKKYYGTDYMDKKLYSNVVDTTKLTPDQVVKKIIGFVRQKHQKSL